MWWIITAIYLSGYLVAYLLLKYVYKKDMEEWTKGSRALILVYSFLSWFAVLAGIFKLAEVLHQNDETPVKW